MGTDSTITMMEESIKEIGKMEKKLQRTNNEY